MSKLVVPVVLSLILLAASAAFGGPGVTGQSSECKELRSLVSGLCEGFLAAKDEGAACSAALRRLDNDEADCGKWIASLQRQINREKQGGLGDPWQWGTACQEYVGALSKRCVVPLATGSPIGGCADELYALEFTTDKMLRVPGNKYMAEEVEKHCTSKLGN